MNQVVMREVMKSPYIRVKFADNEDGYERFQAYHKNSERAIHRSPTYRSSVNLNHEEKMPELAYRSWRGSQAAKPEDKMAYILNQVSQ